MKKRGILLTFIIMSCLLAVSIPAFAVQGIIVGPEGQPLEGFSNVYIIDGVPQPVYNYAENRWYDVFIVGTDENGAPICRVVPSSTNPNDFNPNAPNIGHEECFLGDTLVLMADGSTKRIRDIAAGDTVMGYDFAAGRYTACEVTGNKATVQTGYYILNGGIKVTAGHPFYAKELGITPASTRTAPVTTLMTRELKPYTTLYGFNTSTGPAVKKITLTTIERVNESATVYNLQVDGTRNFFVSPDGILFIAGSSKVE